MAVTLRDIWVEVGMAQSHSAATATVSSLAVSNRRLMAAIRCRRGTIAVAAESAMGAHGNLQNPAPVEGSLLPPTNVLPMPVAQNLQTPWFEHTGTRRQICSSKRAGYGRAQAGTKARK
jgi:hypothetical protein